MECLVATCDKGNPQNDGLSVKRHIVTDLKKNPASEKGQNLAWLALKNRFFISLLMVNNPALSAEVTASALDYSKNYLDSHSVEAEAIAKHPESAAISWRAVEQLAQPGVPLETSFKFYGGPADDAHLAFDNSLRSVVIYSWETFDPISRGLVKVLSFLYNIVPNYGICIILLTFIIKTALHPLTRKALVSGHQMQKLQPHLKSIKEKHGSDPRKQQEEMMRLFQEHKVNPFGSCLPMVVQIPVFIALYYVLRNFANNILPSSADQNLSFMWAFQDISEQFRHIGPRAIIIAVIYGVTQLLATEVSMATTPQTSDWQRKLFRVMPLFIVAGLFLYPNIPSGLVLYWMTTNLWTCGQQVVLKRRLGPLQLVQVSGGDAVVDTREDGASGSGAKPKRPRPTPSPPQAAVVETEGRAAPAPARKPRPQKGGGQGQRRRPPKKR